MIQRFAPEKPPGAWTTQQVIEFMLAEIQKDAFLILCPDNDTPGAWTSGGSNGTLMTSSKAGLRCRDGTRLCPGVQRFC